MKVIHSRRQRNLPSIAAPPSKNPRFRRLPQEAVSFVSCEGENSTHSAEDREMSYTFSS